MKSPFGHGSGEPRRGDVHPHSLDAPRLPAPDYLTVTSRVSR